MLHIPAKNLAATLMAAALMPAFVLTAAIWALPSHSQILAHALVAYAALWLAGAGAVHWGMALSRPDSPSDIFAYAYGLMPTLYATAILLSPPSAALFMLFLGFFAAFHIDRKTIAQRWYVVLRGVMTFCWFILLYAAYQGLMR